MRYDTPLELTGRRYVRMQGPLKARLDGWLDKHRLLERYHSIDSIRILGPYAVRLIMYDTEPVHLSVKSPLTLSEWIQAFDQADED